MDIPFVDILGEIPAKELTKRAGSSIPPAYRLASSTLSIRAPVVTILFNGCSLYQGMQNKDGELLFPQSPDLEKWQKAADAAKAVIDLGIYDLVRNTAETDPFKRAIRSYMGVTLE